MIQAVLFDFGGVFTGSPFEAMRQAATELDMPGDELVELVFGPYERDTDHAWHRVERGELDLADYRTVVRAELQARGLDVDPFEVLQRMASSGSEGRAIRDDVVEAVREVRAGGRRTALVTNNARELRDLWRPLLPLDELFDAVIDSSEVGVRKPDRRIFELALARVASVPATSAFLDDHAGNIRAAEALGLRGILVEPDHRPALVALRELLDDG